MRVRSVRDERARAMRCWWPKDLPERHKAICAVVNDLRQKDAPRRADMQFWMDMYGCSELSAQSVGIWVTTGSGAPPLSLNVARVVVDTCRSEVTQTKPRPRYLTEEGDYKLHRRAKKLQQFMDGLFYETKQSELAPRIFDHAAIMGDGWQHTYEAFDRIEIERVPRWELTIPKAESYTGRPRQMFRSKPYDRYYLLELADQWAIAESGEMSTIRKSRIRDAIDKAPPPSEDELFGLDGRDSDLVMVHEAFRLPDGPKQPGRRSIVVDGATLLDEEYLEEDFPYSRFTWDHDPQFFWGHGICEHLQGIQYEINRLVMDIQEAHHLLGSPYWALPRGASVSEGDLNNIVGHAIEFDGPAVPQIVVPTVVSSDVYQHLENLYRKAFEIARTSPLSAMGEKPAGLNSGEAQRVYEDIGNKRFGPVHDDWDSYHMDVARKQLRLARAIAKRKKSFVARFIGDRFVKTINIKDADIDEEKFVLRINPSSALPTTPAGKTATVEQWINLGWLTPDEGKELMGFPDLEAFMRRMTVNRELVEQQIDAIYEQGTVLFWPEPYDDLQTLKLCMTLAYIEAKTQRVEEEKLDIFRQYVQRCVVLLQPPPQPQAPAGAPSAGPPTPAGPGGPPAPPGPPPPGNAPPGPPGPPPPGGMPAPPPPGGP